MAHLVRLNDVWQMLDHCAAGHVKRSTEHHWVVSYNGKTYRALPLGPHGRRQNPEIETGHVRALLRDLRIARECADRYLDLS